MCLSIENIHYLKIVKNLLYWGNLKLSNFLLWIIYYLITSSLDRVGWWKNMWDERIEGFCCSVTRSCLTLHDPMDCSTPGFAVLHYLLEHAQTHVIWVGDAIQTFYPLRPLHLLPFIFPRIRVFLMSKLFTLGGQSIGASASTSTSVLPMNIQDWFPLGLMALFSLWSKGLSRVFSKTTVQKHRFFSAQLSFFFFLVL